MILEYTSEDFAGWERYPHNLSLTALDVDAGQRYERDAQRLFIPSEEQSELQMLDFTFHNGWYLLSQAACAQSICRDPEMTVFLTLSKRD